MEWVIQFILETRRRYHRSHIGDGLSGGGTPGTVSLALDLNELMPATVDPSADSIAIIDGNVSEKNPLDLATDDR